VTAGDHPDRLQSLDLYLYAGNDPIDNVDPSGHCFGICIDLPAISLPSPPSLPLPDLSSTAHLALGAASFVPGIGTAAAVADAGLYAYEGDYESAALSLTAAVPGGAILSKGEKALKFVRGLDRADEAARVAVDAEKAVAAGDKAASATVRHYTTSKAAEAIAGEGYIRPGSQGKVWLTPDRYATAEEAQARLALENKPEGYFEIPASRVREPSALSRVAAKHGWPGGGWEVTTSYRINVTGLRFTRFE
jgi:hypothetical protein